ncbi:MAG: tetratricopeptide repeat protein [Myxococcales bacterium FL481]|nr:MAG: tetratricopeptide repeat protein [Myxococcales bacterium FL481]
MSWRRGLPRFLGVALLWGLESPPVAAAVTSSSMPGSDLPPPDSAWRAREGEPGSAQPRAEAGSPQPERLQPPLPQRAVDAEHENALDEMERMFARFGQAADVTHKTMRDLLVLEAVRGRELLQRHYEARLREHQAKLRLLRSKAIARYEQFLEQYPNDPNWTPEITLRLAELTFEAASARLARQQDAWDKEFEAWQLRADADEAAAGDPPASPQPDYSRPVALYREVAQNFPRYQHVDAAMYMMGSLLFESEQFDASRQSFLALTCPARFPVPLADGSNVRTSDRVRAAEYTDCEPAHPDSKYLSESWLRVGEVHYDMDELDPALAAYEAATSDPEDRLYPAALIRVAWTLYLKRSFELAAVKLDEFIRYADRVEGTDEGAGAAEFRDEAVRYLAKSYVEEDWNDDGRRDRVWGVARVDRDYAQRQDEPHVPEIYAALGDLFAFQTEFALAIDTWEQVLRRWPTFAQAPAVQSKVMQAYLALHDEDGATRARDALATGYLRGTDWFYANETDPDAIEAGFALAEDALVAAAIDHHTQAQRLRQANDPGAAAEYAIAARAYEAFLERFPQAPSAYEYRFQLAESFYYSEQFARAAEEYIHVRDSNLDDRLQQDAAEGVIFAYEAYVEAEEKAGRFTLNDLPETASDAPLEALPLPPIADGLRAAYDDFVALLPDAESVPLMRYQAARISQRYYDFADAEARFVGIIEQHCDDNIAIKAGQAILNSYVARGDLEGTQAWTKKLMGFGCGTGEELAKFAGELKTLGNAVRFEEATRLYEAGEFEAAADRYVALVAQAPDDPHADRALNNAAVAYEKIGRFGSATTTYERIYTRYPASEFADDALLRTGFNHARFFEFEDAVRKYLKLAESEDFKDSEHRLVALKNAAGLLESLQDYERSSQLYRQWSESADDPAQKAEAAYRAAAVLGKAKRPKRAIREYQRYLAEHGDAPSEAERATEAWLRIGEAYAGLGDRKAAERAWAECIRTFQARGLKMATQAADYPAQAQFLLSEYELDKVLNFKVKGRRLEKDAKKLFDSVLAVSRSYDAIHPYRRIEWTLAAMFRRGYAFETVATKVREAPVPRQLKEYSEAWFAYKDLIDAEMQRFEDKAISLYEETLKRSREFQMSNQWTRRARERLNLFRPADYKLVRDPALELQVEDLR